MNSKKTATFLLATGQSLRTGGPNKLLLPFQNKSLVRRTAETILESKTGPLIVVLGHEARKVHEELQDLDVEFVLNTDYKKGILTSLQSGLRSFHGNVDGFMVVLGDQIFLRPQSLNILRRHFIAADPGPSLIAPLYNGERGHPFLISSHFIPEILEQTEQLEKGARFLFRRHPYHVHLVDMPPQFLNNDVGTPEDYELMRQG
ncbi:MAG TPA: nucleotidyltransferase family protein [Bdellovibrio sp.]|uniref:nucleotidyltransferase family protein n=1 Tax=Bdellovibrio sp. TaxID=28201 RepID=UPI002F1F65EE